MIKIPYSLDLAFETFGVPNNHEALIILHGFFASKRNWRTIARQLADQYFVYALDLRNHGDSPEDAQMDYPAMANDLLAFMNQQQLKRAHLLGHSMGGKVAMWFALHYPERVADLLIADIAPVSYSHCFKTTIGALKNLPVSALTNRKQAEQLLAEHIIDLSYRQFLLQNLQLQNGCYAWKINLTIFELNAPNITAFPNTHDLAAYSGRVLFLAGEVSNYAQAEVIYPLFPKAEIITLPNAGHWLHVQNPEAFCVAVFNFLERT